MTDEEIQIIDGEFWTKPPEPVKIPRSTVVGWLVAAQQEEAGATQALADAEANKTRVVAQLDDAIANHTDTIATKNARVADIQALLDLVPE